MARAEALFARHAKFFESLVPEATTEAKAAIYAACIIAEAIRTEQDDLEFRIIESREKSTG